MVFVFFSDGEASLVGKKDARGALGRASRACVRTAVIGFMTGPAREILRP